MQENANYEVDNNLRRNYASYIFPKGFSCGEAMLDDYFKTRLKRALKSENVTSIGGELLMIAFDQAITVHKTIPIKGMYLDAAPKAIKFCQSLGFEILDEAGIDGTTPMFLSIKTMIAAASAASAGAADS